MYIKGCYYSALWSEYMAFRFLFIRPSNFGILTQPPPFSVFLHEKCWKSRFWPTLWAGSTQMLVEIYNTSNLSSRVKLVLPIDFQAKSVEDLEEKRFECEAWSVLPLLDDNQLPNSSFKTTTQNRSYPEKTRDFLQCSTKSRKNVFKMPFLKCWFRS